MRFQTILAGLLIALPAARGAGQDAPQRQAAREALFVAKVDGSQGAAARLNKALFDNNLTEVKGDSEVIELVRRLRTTLDEPYRQALDAVLATIAPTGPAEGVSEARVKQLIAEALAARDSSVAKYVPGRVNGDLIVTGKVCITQSGSCHPDAAAQLQVVGKGDATALFVSNMNGQQYQSPRVHVAQKSLSADGGFRDIQNGYTSVKTTAAFDPVANRQFQSAMVQFADPTREYSVVGTDSRGAFCLAIHKPGVPHEYTQDVCFRTYEEQKVIGIESWRPDWKFKFGTSSGFITLDRWHTVVPDQPPPGK